MKSMGRRGTGVSKVKVAEQGHKLFCWIRLKEYLVEYSDNGKKTHKECLRLIAILYCLIPVYFPETEVYSLCSIGVLERGNSLKAGSTISEAV